MKVTLSAITEVGIRKILQRGMLKFDKVVQLLTAISLNLEKFLWITETVKSICFKEFKTL